MATPTPQPITTPLTKSATFLTLTATPHPTSIPTIRSTLADLNSITQSINFRDPSAALTCIAAIGPSLWHPLTNHPPPAELHPFRPIHGAKHTAVSTPGDLLLHIRAERRDFCFEVERRVMQRLGDAVRVVDLTVGFRYFDARDLLGFVDGTANPVGAEEVRDAAIVAEGEGEGDGVGVGGSYVVVQKYLHDLEAWGRLRTEEQEEIVGRTKMENVELEDAEGGRQRSHKTLNTIEKDGEEFDILRDNMPFGAPSKGEFGTYFIGYSRRLWVIEKMLERMYVGDPPGLHDRILDFSRPVTGTTFFAPSASFLSSLA
ncbi:Dyp-type peroxidase [Corynespora cassiicola Philippines]|uniref:Dyp-type peroxidase n=1 Tax=Corynespora cassiicola Philippines TaxID=1448308 RepID=A0A2T2NXN7_CORCC|nr:Dyp-type peroxidase [Corynespora cassiicola Philippines]